MPIVEWTIWFMLACGYAVLAYLVVACLVHVRVNFKARKVQEKLDSVARWRRVCRKHNQAYMRNPARW